VSLLLLLQHTTWCCRTERNAVLLQPTPCSGTAVNVAAQQTLVLLLLQHAAHYGAAGNLKQLKIIMQQHAMAYHAVACNANKFIFSQLKLP
jgi:hypothetical protein